MNEIHPAFCYACNRACVLHSQTVLHFLSVCFGRDTAEFFKTAAKIRLCGKTGLFRDLSERKRLHIQHLFCGGNTQLVQILIRCDTGGGKKPFVKMRCTAVAVSGDILYANGFIIIFYHKIHCKFYDSIIFLIRCTVWITGKGNRVDRT